MERYKTPVFIVVSPFLLPTLYHFCLKLHCCSNKFTTKTRWKCFVDVEIWRTFYGWICCFQDIDMRHWFRMGKFHWIRERMVVWFNQTMMKKMQMLFKQCFYFKNGIKIDSLAVKITSMSYSKWVNFKRKSFDFKTKMLIWQQLQWLWW